MIFPVSVATEKLSGWYNEGKSLQIAARSSLLISSTFSLMPALAFTKVSDKS